MDRNYDALVEYQTLAKDGWLHSLTCALCSRDLVVQWDEVTGPWLQCERDGWTQVPSLELLASVRKLLKTWSDNERLFLRSL